MWTTAEIIALIVVLLIICSFPLLYNLFGKEYPKKDGSCGTETLWDRIKSKFKKDKSDSN